jgi:hypothetical protein
VTGPQGPPGPANRIFGGEVAADGTVLLSGGFAVTHVSPIHFYSIVFPAGTFSGNEGRFLIPVVTPIGTATVISASRGPIVADGSGAFQVSFTADTTFTCLVAVGLT